MHNNVIRCTRRFSFSELPLDAQTPYFIPNRSRLVILLALHLHFISNPASLSFALSQYRLLAWTSKLRSRLKVALNECYICQRTKWQTLARPAPPPQAPWSGRHFERLVRTIKVALATAISKKLLTLEEFTTVVKESEATVSNSPLTYQQVDSQDIPLTPSQLIRGHNIDLLPTLRTPATETKSIPIDCVISMSSCLTLSECFNVDGEMNISPPCVRNIEMRERIRTLMN